jgi:hypothetical protein
MVEQRLHSRPRFRLQLDAEPLVRLVCADLRDQVQLSANLVAEELLWLRLRHPVGQQGVGVLAAVGEPQRDFGSCLMAIVDSTNAGGEFGERNSQSRAPACTSRLRLAALEWPGRRPLEHAAVHVEA